MKLFYSSLLFLFISSLYCNTPDTTIDTNKIHSIKIKVLLDEYKAASSKILTIKAKEGLILRVNRTQKKPYLLKEKTLRIAFRKNSLYVNTKQNIFKKVKNNEISLKSISNIITINKTQYHGELSLKIDPQSKKLFLINSLDLEDYVYGVLLAEIYQTWPHNMQKIQAIVSRTYAIHQMLQRKKKAPEKRQPYDIKNTTFHQRYKGTHDYHHLREAVIETKNLILTYNNDIVLAMFDGCCGGSITAHIRGLDFTKAPYLARTTACTYCKKYVLHTWKRTLSTPRFLNYLYRYAPISSKLSKKKNLFAIAITDKDKAGVVHEVTIKQSPDSSVAISGRDLWMSMNNLIRSQNFTIKKAGNSIIINGRGFGHQLGLCQRGARELVRKGWPVKKILEFYYPNTTIARLKVVPSGKAVPSQK